MTRLFHVGLGKTATTTLQKVVFPQLAQHFGQTYMSIQDDAVQALLACITLDRGDLVDRIPWPDDVLMSCESLCLWDPYYWEQSARILSQAVGRNTEILLTVRDPRSLMTSYYLQMCVQEQNVMLAEEYFLPNGVYSPSSKAVCFAAEMFSYDRLCRTYLAHFDKLHVVKFSAIMDLSFLPRIWPQIGASELDQLRLAFKAQRNASYSARSVQRTFGFRRRLTRLGYDLLPTQPYVFQRHHAQIRKLVMGDSATPPSVGTTWDPLVTGHVANMARWRNLCHNVFDRYQGYEKFSLDFDRLPQIPLTLLEQEYANLPDYAVHEVA